MKILVCGVGVCICAFINIQKLKNMHAQIHLTVFLPSPTAVAMWHTSFRKNLYC